MRRQDRDRSVADRHTAQPDNTLGPAGKLIPGVRRHDVDAVADQFADEGGRFADMEDQGVFLQSLHPFCGSGGISPGLMSARAREVFSQEIADGFGAAPSQGFSRIGIGRGFHQVGET